MNMHEALREAERLGCLKHNVINASYSILLSPLVFGTQLKSGVALSQITFGVNEQHTPPFATAWHHKQSMQYHNCMWVL